MDQMFRPAEHELMDAGGFAARAEDSFTLPSSWYHDPAVYEREHEAIFYRSWIYQCHVSDVAKPGDYHVGQVADQGIVVMRGQDGELRAFYNVCSHRAHPLLAGQGNVRMIVCPYHQWSYQPDGCFRGARGRKSLECWIPENADLKQVRVEDFGGLLFVNLDPDARPLAELSPKFLADLRAACSKLGELRRVERFELEVAANWKTVVDNNHECYHCDRNHKTLMELVDYDNKASWSNDAVTFTHEVEKKSLANGAYSIEEGLEQEAMFGYVWPTVIPLMYPGTANLSIFQVIPLAPERTLERWDFLLARDLPTVQERRFIDYIKNVLVPEDVGLCEAVQRGLHSRGYRQGRFVVDRSRVEFSEHHVHFFQQLVHDALVGGEVDATLRVVA